MSIRQKIFKAYALQQKSVPLMRVSNSTAYGNDDRIAEGIEAGKVISAVQKLPAEQCSWIEWAYTIHGGENSALKEMVKALRLVDYLEQKAKELLKAYEKTGETVLATAHHAVKNRIRTINNMRSLGRAAGHDFFTWLDRALVTQIPPKTQARTASIIKGIVLAAAVNYRYMAMRSCNKPFYSISDICRMFGISPQSYTQTYRCYADWVYQQCDWLDGEALPIVGE